MYILDADKRTHCQLIVADKTYSARSPSVEAIVGTRGILDEAHSKREKCWKAAEGGTLREFDIKDIKLSKQDSLLISNFDGAATRVSLSESTLRDPVKTTDLPDWLLEYEHRCLELKPRGVYLFVVPRKLNKSLKQAKACKPQVLRRSTRGHHPSGYALRVRKHAKAQQYRK